jgi:hypothetical protein
MRSCTATVNTAPPLGLPEVHENPTTWPSKNAAMDILWAEAVAGEARVPTLLPDPLPTGLDMRTEGAVKPMGSLDDPVMIFSSYPTADPKSTVHMAFGTVSDMSNQSMARLLVKIGFHVANLRSSGMFMVDAFSRRLDRKQIRGNSDNVLDQVSQLLQTYWQTFAFICLDRLRARVLIILGGTGFAEYIRYLRERGITHKEVHMSEVL